jgi:hypothetical protein
MILTCQACVHRATWKLVMMFDHVEQPHFLHDKVVDVEDHIVPMLVPIPEANGTFEPTLDFGKSDGAPIIATATAGGGTTSSSSGGTRSILSRSCTVGAWAASYDPKNLNMAQFPPTANGWGTKYPILDMTPPLLAEEEGPPTKKELDSGVIYTCRFPHLGSPRRAGFCHLSAQSTLSSRPGSARTRAFGNHS